MSREKIDRVKQVQEIGVDDEMALQMIMSGHCDFGHGELGGMISVKKFKGLAKDIMRFLEESNTFKNER